MALNPESDRLSVSTFWEIPSLWYDLINQLGRLGWPVQRFHWKIGSHHFFLGDQVIHKKDFDFFMWGWLSDKWLNMCYLVNVSKICLVSLLFSFVLIWTFQKVFDNIHCKEWIKNIVFHCCQQTAVNYKYLQRWMH